MELDNIIDALKQNKGNYDVIDECINIIEDEAGFDFVPILEGIAEKLYSQMTDEEWNDYLEEVREDILDFIS